MHVRRVHYLYRSAGAAPPEVRVTVLSVALALTAHSTRRGRARFATSGAPPASRLEQQLTGRRGDHVPPEVGPGFAAGQSYLAPVVRPATLRPGSPS